jgi:hypothetical protein
LALLLLLLLFKPLAVHLIICPKRRISPASS